MKVSIVIPTFNRAYILGHALESVLAQEECDFEVLVVDDGSTDGTRELVDSFASARIRYIRHPLNRGCSAAYNTGIAAASGDLVAFLDSDDVWRPGYLKRQVDFLAAHPEVGLVFSNTEIPDGALTSYLRAFPKMLSEPSGSEYVFSSRQIYLCLLEEVPIKPSAAVVRRSALERSGGFEEAWPSGTDWDLFLRLSQVVDSFGYIDAPLVVQRRTPDATHQLWREQDKLFLISVFSKEKKLAAARNDRKALAAINRGLCSHYNSLGWTYLEAGRAGKAVSAYWQGYLETLRPKLLKKLLVALIRLPMRSFIFPQGIVPAPAAMRQDSRDSQ